MQFGSNENPKYEFVFDQSCANIWKNFVDGIFVLDVFQIWYELDMYKRTLKLKIYVKNQIIIQTNIWNLNK